MKAGFHRAVGLALALTFWSLNAPNVDAAKPAGKGGGNNSAPSAASPAPEFYRAEFDYLNRTLTLSGIGFITGDSTTPVFPSDVTIAGQSVTIDPASASAMASVSATDFTTFEGPLILPFDDILTALEGPPTGSLRVVQGERNLEIKVVTGDGTATFSAFFPRDIKDVPADTGSCPCTFAIYTAQIGDAEPGTTFCSEAEGIPTDQYIEAGYGKIDENQNASAVIMGSHSSASPETLYQSTCYVRDLSQIVNGVETPVYLEGPFPVGNGDHQLCVAAIEALEPACTP